MANLVKFRPLKFNFTPAESSNFIRPNLYFGFVFTTRLFYFKFELELDLLRLLST
ncbi:hypothetical protein CAMRE0001_3051 [Campylobacter rectus RM3267]|uniref:Uncharacterized protein n=1 Tax=Campylobacter rectus RM3267 TaxID=553218 RepID=B9D4G3_CAMRE|nr:hypothetical protein [Campylobacter rectus]EEF13126.1 hypothetical protein CAMRE0001_3051 [Campylobacter rectus RM3267]UEB46693.1 hypothetical protein LK437_06595 [Campylobacter rectus]